MRRFTPPLPSLLASLAFAGLVHAPVADAQPPSLVEQARTKVKNAAGQVWHGTQDLAAYALGLIGVAYRFGGNTPEGFDCSGLVYHVFQQVTGVTLPRTAQ